MAYHPIQRVLGESSLGRKLRLMFGSSLLVLITGSFWWYGTRTDALVYEVVAKRFATTGLMELHFVSWDTYKDTSKKEDTATKIIKDIRADNIDWQVILPQDPEINPKRYDPPADDYERDLLAKWEREGSGVLKDDQAITFSFRTNDKKEAFEYYAPIFATEGCLFCHTGPVGKVKNFHLREGDLMAVARVTIPYMETAEAQNANRAVLITSAVVTVFLAMVALYVIVKHVIVKPLTHLREVSDEISRGNIQQRAEISTGDEFEDLGNAFNRMMRHMVEAQNELQGVNDNLDQKVDQLAQANMRLYQMNRLKSDFLATVSHELRTPLNSIIGFSDVLSSIQSLDDKQHRYVENIQRSGRMLLEMINDILDLAKIESGKMKVRLSEFQIKAVIGAQCDMARPLTERKNIDLDYDVDAKLPALYQDQSKVQQILGNLLSNAIKFTPEGGRITVSAEKNANGDLALVVADTGVGITEEDQTVIFEKFRQGTTVLAGGNAMTREYTGTGLGLSIVKELCRLLDGEVSLDSELGKGSTFTVCLPWRRKEQPPLDSELTDSLDALAGAESLQIAHNTQHDGDGSHVPAATQEILTQRRKDAKEERR